MKKKEHPLEHLDKRTKEEKEKESEEDREHPWNKIIPEEESGSVSNAE